MLKLPEGVRIWVATAPCDMRKQADGLSALVENGLGQQPKSGHLFVFFSRRNEPDRAPCVLRTAASRLLARPW